MRYIRNALNQYIKLTKLSKHVECSRCYIQGNNTIIRNFKILYYFIIPCESNYSSIFAQFKLILTSIIASWKENKLIS